MSFEDTGPAPGPDSTSHRSASEQWGAWGTGGSDEDTRPRAGQTRVPASLPPRGPDNSPLPVNPQYSFREHVSGALPVHPADAPRFQPAYNPYAQPPAGAGYYPRVGQAPAPTSPYGPMPPQGQPQPVLPQPASGQTPGQPYPPYPGYPPPGNGYPPPYPGAQNYNGYGYGYPYPYPYGYVPYGWLPPRPKRDGYQLAVAIVSTIGAGLAVLGGLGSALLLFLLLVLPRNNAITESSFFSSQLTFLAFVIAGVAGGGFAIYHGIRAWINRPSRIIWLPRFWIPLVLYLLTLGAGYALQASGHAVTYPALSIALILLAAIFPALMLACIGVRRLRFPTTWRRFTVALVSGATLSIGLALLLELGLTVLVLGSQGSNFYRYIDDPSSVSSRSFLFSLVFLIVAVIGPLVEETVKPLGVAFYIGRMRGAAEAFTLGMAAGIGFALVETMGYIGSGYQDWLSVALERTGASLLHGFGAGMVALGWYYLTHRKQGGGILVGLLCWLYAVFQHFVWNGTAILSLLPPPVGPTIDSWTLNLGFVSLDFLTILNIIEAILILLFFLYMTGRLRNQTPGPSPSPSTGRKPEPAGEPRTLARV